MELLNDIVNLKFGKLLVIEYIGERFETLHNKYEKHFYKCKCDCGNEHITYRRKLLSKYIQSCGCGKLRELSGDIRGLNCVYSSYKFNALKRNLDFNISKLDFHDLSQKNCYYCNRIPSRINPHTKEKLIKFIYNGIDRIDNSKGYSLDNCVSCCTMCNRAKLDNSREDFLKWIREIYLNNFNN